MGLVRTVALVILGLSGLTFIALFGRLPTFRKTPIAFLYKSIWIYIPNGIIRIDSVLLGGRLLSCWNRSGRYLFYENHPLVMVLFLSLMIVGKILLLPIVWPRISTIHHLFIPGVAIAPYIFLYAAAVTNPHITPKNHAEEMERYPYDGIIFYQGQRCRTCHYLKPARSKHCNLCKTCVARHDHHCIWLINCVGRHNYRYFLSFMLSLTVMLVYGSCLGYIVLCQTHDRLIPPGSELRAMKHDWTMSFNIWCVIITQEVRVAMVSILTVMTAPLTMAFLVYHTYLIWAGMTTNESGKWAELKDDVSDGLVFKTTKREMYGDSPPRGLGYQGSSRYWPGSSDQLLLLTDGQPPTEGFKLSSPAEGGIQEGEPDGPVDRRWTRVRSMRDVDNIYDVGFGNNLRDAVNLSVRRRRAY